MLRALLISFSFFSIFCLAQSQEKVVETRELPLVIGIDKVVELDFPFSSNMYLGDSSIVRVEPDIRRKTISFIGVKPGSTSLTIRDNLGEEKVRYILTITANDQSRMVSELRELLGGIEGLEIGIKGGKVYVGGQIVVPNDIGLIATVLESYPDVLRLVDLSPLTQNVIAQKMQEELAKNNIAGVTVRVVNGAFWVEGVVGDEGEEKMVKQITVAYLPDRIEALSSQSARLVTREDKSTILYFLSINKDQKAQQDPLPKLVKISVQFVELSKDYSKIFGFKWAPQMAPDQSRVQLGRRQDGTVQSNSSGTFSAVISNLFPKINSLKNAGYGRILQSGMVITEENTEGTLTKNTQVPFLSGGGEFARTREQNIQFTLATTPRVLAEENIRMQINVTVSLPSGQNSVSGEPITTTNTVKTNVIVKSKESAVIGGVVQSQSLTGYDKNDPSPPTTEQRGNQMFMMLRSKSFNISKNQYVIFVTPELIQSASGGTEEIKSKFRKRGF
jgi:pilus assembly protein CpaC